MGKEKRGKEKTFQSRKKQPNWETERILKTPSKKRREDALKHAVRTGDADALEDYDEELLRPKPGAVAKEKQEDFIDNHEEDYFDYYQPEDEYLDDLLDDE